jgi:hypothetical protein
MKWGLGGMEDTLEEAQQRFEETYEGLFDSTLSYLLAKNGRRRCCLSGEG